MLVLSKDTWGGSYSHRRDGENLLFQLMQSGWLPSVSSLTIFAATKKLSHKSLPFGREKKEGEEKKELKLNPQSRFCNGNTELLQLEHLFNVISLPPATSKSASCEFRAEHHKWD